jgi:uncharacterized DUF497 family protein
MVRFTWEERKNRANRRKHGVSFETATLVFADSFVLFEQDREVESETRWQTIGKVSEQILLLVAHTYEEDEGDETIRILSARRAAKPEEEVYSRQFDPGGHGR